MDDAEREGRVRAIGRQIFAAMRAAGDPPWAPERWKDRLMQLGMAVPALKEKFLLFLDVSPALSGPDQVKLYLLDILSDPRLPRALRRLLRPLPGRLLAPAAFALIRWIAVRFIAGSDAAQAWRQVRRIRAQGSDATLDLLGESLTSEAEADRHRDAYVRLLSETEDANVSVKLSALGSNFSALNRTAHDRIRARLRAVVRAARDRPGTFIWIDMENHAVKDATISIYRQVLEEPEQRGFGRMGIAIQAYLKDAGKDLEDLLAWSRANRRRTPVRLVKGAYWDQENVWAAKAGWPTPVWPEKWRTDLEFEDLARFLLHNRDAFVPAFGTHNARSIAAAIAAAEERGVPRDAYEFQMLYGMGDPIRKALAGMGHRTRVYAPFGDLIPGMAYLVRRVLENTANESFLRLSSFGRRSAEELLARPQPSAQAETAAAPGSGVPEFRNEPLTDWSDPASRKSMGAALARARSQFGLRADPVIGGRAAPAPQAIEARNVSDADEILGQVGMADAALAEQAVAEARRAFPGWRDTPVEERSARLLQAAELLRAQRMDLAAWMVFEVGKSWAEADADAAEAIDFLEYYSREAPRALQDKPLPRMAGVRNRLSYEPLGAGAVISPWNFPLAILTGMTAAAVAAGNCVVMKPAEQSSLIAARLMQALARVLPPGVVNYVPGKGEDVGALLAAHDGIDFIAFTGSAAVGRALRQAVAASANFNKRIVLETGGKNAIYVDRDADMDQAVQGVLDSAFSYSGQKCSACSRLILHQDIHDMFLQRLVAMARALNVGPAADPSTQVGPLIDAEAFAKTARYAALAETEGTLELAPVLDAARRIAGPGIVSGLSPQHPLAQEEIFGPLLTVLKARDLEEAIAIANGAAYGLAAGIFTRSEAHKRRFFDAVRAGVIYANRKITHAQVGVVPFGGIACSGTGAHAGGPDYLRQFVNAKVRIDDLPMFEAGLELR